MDTERIDPGAVTAVLQCLPPFPIVLVSTRTNIITINQIHYFTFSPIRLGISVAHTRHSHGLIEAEGEFVVNVPGEGLVEAVRVCGSVSGRERDKFEAAGLTPGASSEVAAASVAECGAHIECRVERAVDFAGDRTWFIGEVVAAGASPGHRGSTSLLCGRREYRVPGGIVAER